ncbi:hypothetical protein QW060_24490 [Myroides ceti]|uniref:Uncharacterized protein n=1 Tax=Paenimyroides ceti TaxID=395087 RepID=A0ABT8D2D0_9FLAO|nr:hypothetical protein [Paenimyroides ceti]MDN3708025.1 hypothetical protein [Paenimyroides ceti]MDN3709550.1 hypothetical protein [Paenimyroides ceti]MDN3710061.1 hypothetical protein [Paenimyroides ceti]
MCLPPDTLPPSHSILESAACAVYFTASVDGVVVSTASPVSTELSFLQAVKDNAAIANTANTFFFIIILHFLFNANL